MSDLDRSNTSSSNTQLPITPVDPLQAVKGPSIFLLVLGILNVLNSLLNAFGFALSGLDNQSAIAGILVGGGVGFIGLAGAALIIFGAIKMKKLENYTLVMVASIIAMVPYLSSCCLLGLPAGIWSLVVLNKPEVKGAFLS